MQSEKQNATAKLAELQKKHARHLKYVARKSEEQTLSRKSEETGQQSFEDIRSFFAEKSCAQDPDQEIDVEHGAQSDDTIIVSDNEMRMDDKCIVVQDCEMSEDENGGKESSSNEKKTQSHFTNKEGVFKRSIQEEEEARSSLSEDTIGVPVI